MLELALLSPASPAAEAPALPVVPTPAPVKRTRRGWSKARRLAFEKAKATNGSAGPADDRQAERRRRSREWESAKRAAERAAKAAVNGSPTPVNHNAAKNGAAANSEGVSAETFWNRARKLSPKEPWRSVVREFDIFERRRTRGAAEHGAAVGGCRCGRGAVPEPDDKGCRGAE